jgi:succinoglycan biosynthesis transport protein ExoP
MNPASAQAREWLGIFVYLLHIGKTRDMELWNYLEILWRRKWVIIITAVVTMLVTAIGLYMTIPVYEASTTLRVATATSGPWAQVNLQYADRLMNTYSEIATSNPVREELKQRFGVDRLPPIKIEGLANTELMRITVEGEDPILARDVANTLAGILIAQSREVYTEGTKTAREILSEQLAQVEDELNQARTQYESLLAKLPEDPERMAATEHSIDLAGRSIELKERTYATLLERYEQARVTEAMQANAISVVEPASTPENPSSPRTKLSIALASLVGLVGGIGLAFLFENLDTTLYTTKQITDAAKLSPLGMIPAARRRPGMSIFNSNSPEEEAFRHLRTNLLAFNHDQPLQTLLITSAEPGEGKSTVVANLACSLAKSGRKVIVVDGDMRLPTLHKIFDLSNQVGLSSVLKQEVPINEAVQDTNVPGVQVLTSGPSASNPAELLGSSPMTALMEQLVQQFDMVLLDSPALLAVTDAAVLAPTVDGVVLVVSCAQTREETVAAACQQLVSVKARLVGVVVNRAEQAGSYYFYHQTSIEHNA